MGERLIRETIPNLTAINWNPDGGDNQLVAAVEDIKNRLNSSRRPSVAREKSDLGSYSNLLSLVMQMQATNKVKPGTLGKKNSQKISKQLSQRCGDLEDDAGWCSGV